MYIMYQIALLKSYLQVFFIERLWNNSSIENEFKSTKFKTQVEKVARNVVKNTHQKNTKWNTKAYEDISYG